MKLFPVIGFRAVSHFTAKAMFDRPLMSTIGGRHSVAVALFYATHRFFFGNSFILSGDISYFFALLLQRFLLDVQSLLRWIDLLRAAAFGRSVRCHLLPEQPG